MEEDPPEHGAAAQSFGIREATAGEPGHVIVAVSGELDLGTKSELDERLHALFAADAAIELDLSGVTFVDSSGLEVLLRYAQAAARGDVELRIGRALGSQVRRLVELTGVGDLLWPTPAARGGASDPVGLCSPPSPEEI